MNFNIAAIWTAVTTTAGVVLWAVTNFASASDVQELKQQLSDEQLQIRLQIAYDSFYDRLDDYEESVDEGRDELAAEYRKQMERLLAFICEHDPEFTRCDE